MGRPIFRVGLIKMGDLLAISSRVCGVGKFEWCVPQVGGLVV